MVSDFKMKRLKTWKLFNESVDYDLSIIGDMLLDFTDKDINKAYLNMSPQHFIPLISHFRNHLKQKNITDPEKIGEYLYNMIRIE